MSTEPLPATTGPRPARALRGRLEGVFQLGLFRFLLVLGKLLPVGVSHWLGAGLGGLAFLLVRRPRELCLGNLRLAFPDMVESARRELARRCFRHVGAVLLEFFATRRMRRNPQRWLRVEGEQVLRTAQAGGKGVLVVTAHLGNWEMLPLVFDQLAHPVRAVGRFIVNAWINERINGLRESEHFKVIRQETPSSSRELLRVIKGGGTLLTFVDLDTHGPGEFVPFFGQTAYTPRGPASLALRHGLTVVMASGIRLPDGTHRFRFEPVPLPPHLKDRPDGVHEATRILTEMVERKVREQPEQWIWIHKRWRRRPGKDGQPVKG